MRMVKLEVGEEVLESSQQQKQPQPGAAGQLPALVSRLSSRRESGSHFNPHISFVTYDGVSHQTELDTDSKATAFR